MAKAILLILISIGLIAAIVLVFLVWRESKFISDDFFKQATAPLISGALVAIISFFFAWLLNNMQDENKAKEAVVQEENRIKDARMESFIKIHNEISENRLTLGQEKKREKPLVRLPLKTSAWESGKYQTPVKTSQLLDGLKLLYDDIERYNWNVEFMRFKVRESGLSIQNAPEEIWKPLQKILEEVYARLLEFEKLTSREMVLLGKTDKEDFVKRFGKWEEVVNISYFSAKDAN